jgi:AP-3 complex subunit delta
MRGYDMSWAAFNVVEVMSQSKFTAKRIGYLAASQSFSDTTEVVMLTTNLIRKVRPKTRSNFFFFSIFEA